MPKKTHRNKQRVGFSGSPRSVASLLADISRGAVHNPATPSGPPPEALLSGLREGVGAPLGERILQARMRDGALVIYVESAVWAARLRLAVNEHIAAGVARRLPGIDAATRVVVRVMPREGYRR